MRAPPGPGITRNGVQPDPTTTVPRDEPTPAGRGASTFAVAVFVLSTGAFFAVAGDVPDDESRSTVLLLWALAYVGAGIALLDGALRRRMPVRLPAALVLFLGLTALSTLWSVDPPLTLRRSAGLVGTTLVGMLLAQRLRPVEVLDALRRALLLVAVASLLYYLSGNDNALDEAHQTLRGVVFTKNALGRHMAVGLLAAVTVALLDGRRARRCTVSAVPMVIALALTGSTGGSLIAVAVLVCMVGALLWRASAGRIMLVAAIALATGALAVVLPQTAPAEVAGLVGKDATLTGRTDIWSLSLTALGERPVLGHGYGAFWSSSESAARIIAQLDWTVPNAHNGFLDLALELGVPGVGLGALVIGGLLVQGLRDVRDGALQRAALRLPVAAVLVVINLTESGLLQQNVLVTVLLVAAAASGGPGAPDLERARTLLHRPDGEAARTRTGPGGQRNVQGRVPVRQEPGTARRPGGPRAGAGRP